MKEIVNIYPISGLYNELYSPTSTGLNLSRLDFQTKDPLKDVNRLFWSVLLSSENLERMISVMKQEYNKNVRLSDIEMAVLANDSLFVELVLFAKEQIINQAISDKTMFAYMEQIEITCKLLSKYLYPSFMLTIQDGFIEPTLSSEVLIKGMMDRRRNPYLVFLEKYVFDNLKQFHPKLIWINGQPSYSSLAIAAKIKENNPQAIIAIRYHSSEYFSLNKIDWCLLKNQSLFSLIDCIVMDDSVETCDILEKTISSGGRIETCRNLIFINRNDNIIRNTSTSKVEYSFTETIHVRPVGKVESDFLDPHAVMNLRLNPNTACFWNKCTFCGINKKYKFITNKELLPLDEKIKIIEQYVSQGIRFLWFEDEAIPSEDLDAFASAILDRNIDIMWQARSRLDIDINDDLAIKLYNSGLREIRFGLESCNKRIWSLMNKFPESFSFSDVERTVDICSRNGIHVHFPMIVGFPSETMEERIDTYEHLKYLRDKYGVSYNINVLMLDVSSDLYKNHEKYGLEDVELPCPPECFLGNMSNFTDKFAMESEESIDAKRNEFMRETLYPWMPATALVKPNIFYRLSETIRNTLVWNSVDYSANKDIGVKLVRNKNLSVWKADDNHYRVYNWNSHYIFDFSNEDFLLFQSIKDASSEQIENNEFYAGLFNWGLLEYK